MALLVIVVGVCPHRAPQPGVFHLGALVIDGPIELERENAGQADAVTADSLATTRRWRRSTVRRAVAPFALGGISIS